MLSRACGRGVSRSKSFRRLRQAGQEPSGVCPRAVDRDPWHGDRADDVRPVPVALSSIANSMAGHRSSLGAPPCGFAKRCSVAASPTGRVGEKRVQALTERKPIRIPLVRVPRAFHTLEIRVAAAYPGEVDVASHQPGVAVRGHCGRRLAPVTADGDIVRKRPRTRNGGEHRAASCSTTRALDWVLSNYDRVDRFDAVQLTAKANHLRPRYRVGVATTCHQQRGQTTKKGK